MNLSNLKKLQQLLATHGLDGYIIPSTDEYQGEYTAMYAKRLQYITGFTGSNGIALILLDKAVLFTDGRYLTQASRELDIPYFQIIELSKLPALEWEDYFISTNNIIGYDPKLFTLGQLKLFKKLKLKSIEKNLVDLVWNKQPEKPSSQAYIYPLKYAGEDFKEKIKKIQDYIIKHKAHYCLITSSDSICWALNIRAHDLEYSPLIHGYLLVGLEKSYLFTNKIRTHQIEEYLNDYVKIYDEEKISLYLQNLHCLILLDESRCPTYFIELIKTNNIEYFHMPDPCMLLKSVKNEIELKNIIDGHVKDAIALCEFFGWLDESIENNDPLNEYLLDEKLTYFRSKLPDFVFPSFASICGFETNSAIIHYRADENSAKTIQSPGILLIDSGGQYYGCTTDVTRTIIVGNPTDIQIKRYTQVLKSHIKLAQAKFPKGTSGIQLDTLARFELWQEGLDYAHGTGHGVGAFLSVHEGPQRISNNSHVPLKAGMVLSNEPGFYKVGEFGIRIENLIYVSEIRESGFLEFINLTLVPYCHHLIDYKLLSHTEIQYLKNYYETIKQHVLPSLSQRATSWVWKEIGYILEH